MPKAKPCPPEFVLEDPLERVRVFARKKRCAHLKGYWVFEQEGIFRCLGCGYQQCLTTLPKRQRDIGPWKESYTV